METTDNTPTAVKMNRDKLVMTMIAKTASLEEYYRERIEALERENAMLREQAAVSKVASDADPNALPAAMAAEFGQAVQSLADMGLVSPGDVGAMTENPRALFSALQKTASMGAPSITQHPSQTPPSGNMPVDRSSPELASNRAYNESMQNLRMRLGTA